jgi:hypothetical protein
LVKNIKSTIHDMDAGMGNDELFRTALLVLSFLGVTAKFQVIYPIKKDIKLPPKYRSYRSMPKKRITNSTSQKSKVYPPSKITITSDDW